MKKKLLICIIPLSVGCDTLKDLVDGVPKNCAERQAWYPDADGDGTGANGEVWVSCDQPDGYVSTTGDCNDGDPTTTECPDTAEQWDTGDSGP